MASLTIVGTGIKFLSHLTTEANAYIEQSDKVLYLVNDPVLKAWIEKKSINSESLDHLYFKFEQRKQAYSAITQYILDTLKDDLHICMVLYGHPTVYAEPALEAAKLAKAQGFDVKILPAISAENCLFADLMIDPGSCGCLSYEATDFLYHQKSFHTGSHLILWQIGMLGELGHELPKDNKRKLELKNYLAQKYPLDHPIYIYEAAQYPGFSPRIDIGEMQNLHLYSYSTLSTLYIPPHTNTAS